jgi:hypothetical protein
MVQIFHDGNSPRDPFQAAHVSSRTRGATPHALRRGLLMVPTPRRTGPRFLKGLDPRLMAAFIGQPAGSATALSPPRSARLSPKPGRAPYLFRMIQVCPKDLPAAPRLR